MIIERDVMLSIVWDNYDPVRDIVYNSVHILPITTIGSKVTRPVAGSVGISVGINIKSEIKEYGY